MCYCGKIIYVSEGNQIHSREIKTLHLKVGIQGFYNKIMILIFYICRTLIEGWSLIEDRFPDRGPIPHRGPILTEPSHNEGRFHGRPTIPFRSVSLRGSR